MAVITFNYDRARELGLNVNSHSSFPDDCYTHTFIGCVLSTYERNGYDDSDFFAIVWDEQKQVVRDVEYATTRGWTYNNSAVVDATDEVKAKAAAHWRGLNRKAVESRVRAEMAKPHIGGEVVVARGRKVPKGFRGVVRLLEKRVNAFKPQPRYATGAWDTRETWALVVGENASWSVKTDYLNIIPNPAAVDEAVEKALAEYDAVMARAGNDLSWRSQPYQNMYLAGVNLDKVA
jgi:hypothetical protein